LLCALTSADLGAYTEPASDEMPGIVSGKFRVMLIDIFCRSYDEKKFFMVDRDAVVAARRASTAISGNCVRASKSFSITSTAAAV
jgi:hypothetical protein